MTEEQKAKAYDNVRQKILVRFGSNVVKEIFSEYEESEDERMRKALIKCIERFPYDRLETNGVSVKDAIAWLEKQGENQKLDGTFVNVDDVRESFVDTVYNILSDDPTNDRANDIINAFDNLPSITISNQYPQILANSAKTCKDKQKLLPKCGQLHNN